MAAPNAYQGLTKVSRGDIVSVTERMLSCAESAFYF